ncbi:molybdenum cofactor biosynthesis protein C [Globisporangium polare]
MAVTKVRELGRSQAARALFNATSARTSAPVRDALHPQHNSCAFSSSASSSAADATDASSKFTHLSRDGRAPQMVDVGDKRVTRRSATARTLIRLPPAVLDELRRLGGSSSSSSPSSELLVGPKGPIGATAIIAGVLGAKQTSALIPFCHPLPIEDCQVAIRVAAPDAIEIECRVRVTHKTGVEMEALTGASVAALCVYDMCKALSHDIVIESTRLVEKTGGKSDFKAQDEGEVQRGK